MGLLQKIKSFLFQNVGGVMSLLSSGDYSQGFSWSRGESLSLYEKSLYANSAIRKRAEKTGGIEFQIENDKGEVLDNNPEAAKWLALLGKPNQWQTGSQFWELAQKYYDTVGSCFIRKKFSNGAIFKEGRIPDELELLRADLVSVQMDAGNTTITKFIYSGGGQQLQLTPAEIIYWYRPSMKNPLLGESLIAAAANAIESEYHISKYHANVLKNGGKLETIFKVKNLTSQKQLTELEESYKEKYAEAKKLGRPLFMGGDIESVTTALSPQELAYLDTKVANYKDLAIVTGVPKEVLANTDGSTYQNADAAIRIFLRETVKPNMKSLTDVLDWRLIPEGFNLAFVDPTPEDKEEMRKDLETAKNIQALTTNEMREKLGFDPRKEEEADSVLVPFSLRALGDIAKPEPAPTENTPTTNDPNATDPNAKSNQPHPLRDKRVREVWAKAVDMARRNFDERMLRATRSFFSEQKNRVLDSLRGKRKIAVDEVFNTGLEITIAKATLVETLRQIFIEQGEFAADSFNLPKFSMTMAVEQSLRERADLFTNSIINTQKEKLIEQFKASAEAGEARAELIKRVGDLYQEISEKRAVLIARTEVHAAVSNANLAAYEQGGLKIKIWTAILDDRTRDEHEALDGEERGIHEAFSNGLQYPSEPNCRCTI